jgi:hypothetical protein
MAKISGLGFTTFSVDNSGGSANDIRNDVTQLAVATPRGVQDSTGIDKSAMERILLLADMSVTPQGIFNAAANKSHQTLRTVSSTTVLRTTTLGIAGEQLAAEIYYTDYSLARGTDGAFTWQAPGVLGDGTVPAWTTP